ncbi:MAG: serine/threonine protein kinase, partial [Planctomycetaceae bacterium]|nr:serine/threonine protein kinase [Planctomycetaceae bacterium]
MSNEADGASEQSVAVKHLIAEFMQRSHAGESLDVEQFIKEHPEHAAELTQHFSNVDLLEDSRKTESSFHDETILSAHDHSEEAIANTLVPGTVDSDTSITRQYEGNSTSSSTNLEIPESFGRYAIQKVLGQGAMGAVYLARDTQLDRDVALKIPKFGDGNGVDDQELLERFYREARASATLRSPNICPVYDVGDIDGQHYITMAYIEGRPLKDYTKSKKKHSEKQIISTIRKLAMGLEQAHKIGVIHRDLKPANIMVDEQGEPVVMDFGLARRSSSDDVQVTQSGAILGTPAYMSPEQVEGDQSLIGPQTDIYALGVIMYELLTGEMPFKGGMITMLSQIAANDPIRPLELRPDLDPRLEKICLKMMAGDLSKRYQSMTDVAKDLQKVLRQPNSQQQEAAKKTGSKPTSLPGANEESNPALITVEHPKSYVEQLRNKNRKTRSQSSASPKSEAAGKYSTPHKKLLIGGGLGALLLLAIVSFVSGGKYDVQITLDDPSMSLKIDGDPVDNGSPLQLSAGPHELSVELAGFPAETGEFTVSQDGKNVVHVAKLDGKLAINPEGGAATAASSV